MSNSNEETPHKPPQKRDDDDDKPVKNVLGDRGPDKDEEPPEDPGKPNRN